MKNIGVTWPVAWRSAPARRALAAPPILPKKAAKPITWPMRAAG